MTAKKLKREAANESGAAQRLRDEIAELDGKIARIVDAIADHGRTAALDKKLGKLESLIAETLGGPVPVDPKGVARLDLTRMVVAGARSQRYLALFTAVDILAGPRFRAPSATRP